MTHKANVVFHIVPERERDTNENVILNLQYLGGEGECAGYHFLKSPWGFIMF